MDDHAIIAKKREALERRKQRTPIEAVRALASMQKRPLPILNTVTEGAGMLLIGEIRYSLDAAGEYDPVALALRFAREGMDGINLFNDDVLYDEGLNDLTLVARAVRLPIMSQDYIIDEYQVIEARAAGASALLLRAGIVEQGELRALVSATQRNRMTAVVHVEDEGQLAYALTLSPQVIAIGGEPAFDMQAVADLRGCIPHLTSVLLARPLRALDEAQAANALRPDAVLISSSLLSEPSMSARLRQVLG
jgi:indole-3-glycerol phosphate synthase